ncbi:hypothetical protein TVAG_464450 [Trichomonas vaginalis G3]|uniref:Uncharacterized protein n=1 Tax=Trichomonas vaginalis (strain ATCC PRA-98 / G3) TaxID=412133 RepID=A2EEJ0_TRIV3|nr:axon ensheathment [Trichomonas vaginalis G3]EAY08897.1 hypothetical protein TVAG_464450 [Trichomonas vaginalis G3]KAI5494374.1 axon ensheathment [Trichomonas vaginalis G3]|eukprot:XP_001321120.1 hypothetical protein [Trichomonas vaginalis G3]
MSDSIRIENFEQIESLISDLEGGILGALNAEILSSKGKPKKCVVVLSYFGIHIFRPVIFARTWKIKLFVSELNINSIEYADENTRIISAGKETIHLKSKDIDLVENSIITVHCTLMQDSNVHLELNFINYPKEKPRYPIRTEKHPRIQAIRFSILCAKYNQPFNSSITRLFSEFAISHRTSITFDSSLTPIENPKTIIGTLLFEPNITILQFDNFCPECIGFIIAEALKKLKSLRSIVLMNYPSIQFNQNRKSFSCQLEILQLLFFIEFWTTWRILYTIFRISRRYPIINFTKLHNYYAQCR